jgi:hypothetical protein
MNILPNTIWRHIKTGNLYEIIGIGRLVESPTKQCVIYKQLYTSNLKGDNILLPKGSIWVRNRDSFIERFEKED